MIRYTHMGSTEITTTVIFTFAIGAGLGYYLTKILFGV
jgi:hypothetical protein